MKTKFKDQDFRKSSFCSVKGGGCIEIASDGMVVGIRDSEDKQDIQWHTKADWDVLVKGIKAGEFD